MLYLLKLHHSLPVQKIVMNNSVVESHRLTWSCTNDWRSLQLQSSLSGLPHCIIQHVLLKPTINKWTAPDSLGEPELPEVNALQMTCCPHSTAVQHPFGSIWHPGVEIQSWNASETFVSNTTAVMKAKKQGLHIFFLLLSSCNMTDLRRSIRARHQRDKKRSKYLYIFGAFSLFATARHELSTLRMII